jgi:glutaryl-CoA dehydrogenase
LEALLTDEEKMIQESARTFAQQVLQPKILEAYRQEKADLTIMKELGGEAFCDV